MCPQVLGDLDHRVYHLGDQHLGKAPHELTVADMQLAQTFFYHTAARSDRKTSQHTELGRFHA